MGAVMMDSPKSYALRYGRRLVVAKGEREMLHSILQFRGAEKETWGN
jgi:hypothetical protein